MTTPKKIGETEKKLYPPDSVDRRKYTATDEENVKLVLAWLEAHSKPAEGIKVISQAALSRMARISSGGLSQVLNGTYNGSPTNLLKQVLSAISHAEEGEKNTTIIVETSVFKMANTACNMARRYRNFALLTANVGTGKTSALKYYQKNNPNVFLIESDATMSAGSLVRELAKLVLGSAAKGPQDMLFSAVIEELKDTDSLFIFDEADKVTPGQLEISRRLRDKANVGVVLSGTVLLHYKINPKEGEFDQIRSRVGFWPPTIKSIEKDDGIALTQAYFDEEVPEDVIERLWQLCGGSARMLCENLIPAIHQYRKDHPLSVDLVNRIAEVALFLK